jgi:hypothetical protein
LTIDENGIRRDLPTVRFQARPRGKVAIPEYAVFADLKASERQPKEKDPRLDKERELPSGRRVHAEAIVTPITGYNAAEKI